MKSPFLIQKIINTPMMIQPDKLEVIFDVLDKHVIAASSDWDGGTDGNDSILAIENGVAIISICGTLVNRDYGMNALSGLTSYDDIGEAFDAALADSNVQTIVLEFDSPGGEVSGCFDLADAIYNARGTKPILAVANDKCASAAFALASAADKRYITRTSCIGSIGVIAKTVDQTLADAQEGLVYTILTAGKHKADGNPHVKLTDSARSNLQAEIDRINALFCATVARNCGLQESTVLALEAAVFYGENAIIAGLADELKTLPQLLASLGADADAELNAPGEPSMSTDNIKPTDQPSVDLAAEVAKVRADASEIAELCAIAGFPERSAAFIKDGTSISAVSRQLINAQAERSIGEVSSFIAPINSKAADGSIPDDALVAAIKAKHKL